MLLSASWAAAGWLTVPRPLPLVPCPLQCMTPTALTADAARLGKTPVVPSGCVEVDSGETCARCRRRP